MTKEEILEMKTGEELDRLVATEVMGEPIPEFTPENALDLQLAGSPVKSPQGNWLCLCRYDEGDIPTWRSLAYSTDISAAWLLVEKMCNWDVGDNMLILKGQGPNLEPTEENEGVGWWEAEINGDWGKVIAEGKIAAEAICKVALLAKYSPTIDERAIKEE